MPFTPTPRRIAALLLTLPIVVGASACSPGDQDVPSAPSSPGEQVLTFEEYQLRFAACLRGEGVDMDDPTSAGMSISGADDAFVAAVETCRAEIGRPPARGSGPDGGGPADDDLRAEHLRIAQCLREHGVDVADPGPGEDLAIPGDVPASAFEACAPGGVMGSTGGGS